MPLFGDFFKRERPESGNFGLSEEARSKIMDKIRQIQSDTSYPTELKLAAEDLRNFLTAKSGGSNISLDEEYEVKGLLGRMGLTDEEIQNVFSKKS